MCPEPSLFVSLALFLVLLLLSPLVLLPSLPLSVVVFHCTVVVLQFMCSCLFRGSIPSGWSAISWFLVPLIVMVWGFLDRCHCIGGGVVSCWSSWV
jgi:hypothetical protein